MWVGCGHAITKKGSADISGAFHLLNRLLNSIFASGEQKICYGDFSLQPYRPDFLRFQTM